MKWFKHVFFSYFVIAFEELTGEQTIKNPQ
jgi:hypothetical protein